MSTETKVTFVDTTFNSLASTRTGSAISYVKEKRKNIYFIIAVVIAAIILITCLCKLQAGDFAMVVVQIIVLVIVVCAWVFVA